MPAFLVSSQQEHDSPVGYLLTRLLAECPMHYDLLKPLLEATSSLKTVLPWSCDLNIFSCLTSNPSTRRASVLTVSVKTILSRSGEARLDI